MKLFLTTITLLALSLHLGAAETINSKESLNICKSAIEKDAGDGFQYKVHKKVATSVKPTRYKHLINLTEVGTDKKREAKKVVCQTDREGQLTLLEFKPGRWRI